ncbi:MAG: DedA family protein [Deltaproteobacteria bacterium]|nr:DedA family protein [Deltaproteobacteria bacterium]
MIDLLAERASTLRGIFLLCAGAGWLVPVPQDVTLAWAGVLVADGTLAPGVVLLVSLAGVLLRDLLLYAVGRLVGDGLVSHPRLARWLGGPKITRARAMIARQGGRTVFLGRFLVGMRSPVFVAAGLGGMRLAPFLLWDTVGALLTVPLGLLLGWGFGRPILAGLGWAVHRMGWSILVTAALLLVVQRLWARARVEQGAL